MMMRRWALAALLILSPICMATPHFNATGRIGVLCIGDTS